MKTQSLNMNTEDEVLAPDPAVVNGKRYSLWPQFVQRKHQYIGKKLQDLDNDPLYTSPGDPIPETTITDIVFKPNGKESAWFEVVGETFSCGFDVAHGGVRGGDHGWITFSGYGGHTWRIEASNP